VEIVTGEPAPTVSGEETGALLREMAAVVRTIFAVRAHAPAAPQPQPVHPVDVPLGNQNVPAHAPQPAPLTAIPLPQLDELAFLDE
jgi:hypothetical protein